jgi:hypothetical protein
VRPPSYLGYEAYRLVVHQIRLQRSDLRPSDHLVAVDVLLRREPDEDEEDENEDEGSRKEDDDDEGESDDGYSE